MQNYKFIYMKTKLFVGMLLSFLCAVSITSCDNENGKDKIYPLSFAKEYYECPLLTVGYIDIRGGNRDYTITVENPEVLDIDVDLSNLQGMGNLKVNPKKKGETIVSVKDNITNETIDLKIKIIDSYLTYSIKESNHPALANGTVVYLINNEAKDCYFFRYIDYKNELSHTPISKGSYEFSIKLESGSGNSTSLYPIPYLTLNYASNEQGEFTDASIPPTPKKLRFDFINSVENTNNILLNMIHRFLGVDWQELAKNELQKNTVTKTNAIIPYLVTTIDDTDYEIGGILSATLSIPENLLE